MVEDVPEVDANGAISWNAPNSSFSGIQPVVPRADAMELDSIVPDEKKAETQSKQHENKLQDDDEQQLDEDAAIAWEVFAGSINVLREMAQLDFTKVQFSFSW